MDLPAKAVACFGWLLMGGVNTRDAGKRKLGYARPDPVGEPGARTLISILYPLVQTEAHVATDPHLAL